MTHQNNNLIVYNNRTYIDNTANSNTPNKNYTPRWIIPEDLARTCKMTISSFAKFGETVKTDSGVMIYIDNNSDVLAVGHLDTVQQAREWSYDSKTAIFKSPQLDDRLGVHILLNVLQQQTGLKYDILLTDGEEVGKSTARFFEPKKDYNFMFEIDRFGPSDAAMYQYLYGNDVMRKHLTDCGFTLVHGSNTDIAYLDYLGCMGVNFSCCYNNNHSLHSYANLDDLDIQMDRISKFLLQNIDTVYKYDPTKKAPPVVYNSNVYNNGAYNESNAGDNNSHGWDSDNCDDTAGYYAKNKRSNVVHRDQPALVNDTKSCIVCRSFNCKGPNKCTCCGFSFHSDVYTLSFGLCLSCLLSYFEVTPGMTNEFVNGRLDGDRKLAHSQILELIGGHSWVH